jgi:hypothetical protein
MVKSDQQFPEGWSIDRPLLFEALLSRHRECGRLPGFITGRPNFETSAPQGRLMGSILFLEHRFALGLDGWQEDDDQHSKSDQ